MDIESQNKYELSQSLMNHNGAVRAIDIKGNRLLSGSIDRKVNLYVRNSDTGKFEAISQYGFFPEYIYAVKFMDDGEKFLVGSKDKNIYVCAIEDQGAPMLILDGHTGPVNCLEQRGMTVVSGSWDGTAKIWDLETGQCIKTLADHSYAVTVCILADGNILTGSQDGFLHLWNSQGTKLRTVQAHENIIRSIVELPTMGILTVANDSKTKIWSLDLDPITEMEDHSSFIFAACSLSSSSVDFATGGEDLRLLIYRECAKEQEILHPSTIWAICVDPQHDQDIITASGDGLIRVFTRVVSKRATEDEIASFKNEAEMSSLKGAEIDEKTIAAFPTVEDMKKHPGKKEGDIRVFRTGMVPKAYMWKEGKWDYVGEVMSQNVGQKKYYEGDRFFPAGEYDFVFEVDAAEGLPKLQLPYNMGDNTLIVAEKFLMRESLPVTYKEQIMKFIKDQSGQGGKKSAIGNNPPKTASNPVTMP